MIEYLLRQDIEDSFRLYLLNQYLENFKGTMYRQTMFAEFERETHALVESGNALNSTVLSNLYASLYEQYHGPALTMDEDIRYEWSRIPHFYRPFYVYKYATGYSAAVYLSEQILSKGSSAVTPYLEFLSLGGSQDPLDSLLHAGVDMTRPEPISLALDKFDRILSDAEEIAAR
ncbi:MAG: M3 family metallopeptidase [Bianqueaceae bacterium]